VPFVFKKCGRQRAAPVNKARRRNNATLRRLRSFLDAQEPQTVRWLVSNWEGQQNAITYAEIREAILTGGMSERQLNQWQRDYAVLINEKLAPQWRQAMAEAAAERQAMFPLFRYDPNVGAAQAYIQQHGGQLITNLVAEQRDAIQAMIAQAAYFDGITPDSLSHLIRPVIGLTRPQTLANLNYYNNMVEGLLKDNPTMRRETAERRAREAAAKYAGRQHRHRAMTIARTELAMAYNNGAFGAIKDAQEKGYIGDCKKTWVTGGDERVCPICQGLDGETVHMDALFSHGVLFPPAHPNCRCSVVYEEVTQPITPPTPEEMQETPLQSEPPADIISVEEQQLQDFEALLDTLPPMPDAYRAAVIERFKNGTEEGRAAFLKHAKQGSIGDSRIRGAEFDPAANKINMNYLNDLNDRRGAGNTFFHEYGHYIDWNSRTSRINPIASRASPLFGDQIRADLLRLERDAKKLYGVRLKGETWDNITRDILTNYSRPDVNGLSDIIEGVTKIQYPMGYGHGAKYWKHTPVEIEAFAHMYAAQFDPVKRQALQQYLPGAYGVFENILKGLI
jgi:SPP1 gp7 family putative phage head morphogenesis protein